MVATSTECVADAPQTSYCQELVKEGTLLGQGGYRDNRKLCAVPVFSTSAIVRVGNVEFPAMLGCIRIRQCQLCVRLTPSAVLGVADAIDALKARFARIGDGDRQWAAAISGVGRRRADEVPGAC